MNIFCWKSFLIGPVLNFINLGKRVNSLELAGCNGVAAGDLPGRRH